MSFTLSGKTALVTGANRGIGKAIVEALLKRGATKVYAAVRTLSTAEPLVEQYGSKVVPLQVDLTLPDTISAAAQVASDVDIVINNAGILKLASPLDPGVFEALEAELKVNVYGLLHVAQAFAPVLKANGGGALVQLNSVASLKGFAPLASYSASKAAAYSFTQSLYWQLKEQGTHVVSVQPGPIDTDMAADAGMEMNSFPPSMVAEAIMDSLEKSEFHLFPDPLSQQFGATYDNFAKGIVEAPFEG